MSGMTESAHARKNRELLGQPDKKVALHVPTNRRYAINMEIPGAGVELEDLENNVLYVTWAKWQDNDIWSKQP
jgi:hypothetical protein